MKNSVRVLILLAMMGTVIGTAAETASVSALLAVLPAVVADYGRGRQITGAEVKSILLPQLQVMLVNGRPASAEEIATWAVQVTESIIDQHLLLEEARREGSTVDPEVGKQLIARQRQDLGEENFASLLILQGISESEFAQRLAENHAVNEWIKTSVAPKQTVTPAEVKSYYETHLDEFPRIGAYRVSHILFEGTLETSYEKLLEAQEAAEAVHESLLQGTAFATLAKKHSACPSGADGGDLGFLTIGSMPKQFEEAALALAPGQISPVVRSPLGYHIIRGHEVRPAGTLPFEEVREKLAVRLRNRAMDEAMSTLRENLRRKAGVKIYVSAP